jgi:triphosphoribosyl-dephospho-CoA synthase
MPLDPTSARRASAAPAARLRPSPLRLGTARFARAFADLVCAALLIEVRLTPKPGLVDLRNNGAHADMSVATFVASTRALRPRLGEFFRVGAETANLPSALAFERLREVGLDCERAMFAATHGVNTHKGAIFSFGLLLGAAGRLWAGRARLDSDSICEEAAALVRGIVGRELARPGEDRTAGERLFHRYGLKGARGEAESGFASVRERSLPAFARARAAGRSEEEALLAALLNLLAHNDDTNLAARGGLDGLRWAQRQARSLADEGGVERPDFIERMAALDDAFIARNLSPGGSADLVAVTWALHQIDLRARPRVASKDLMA